MVSVVIQEGTRGGQEVGPALTVLTLAVGVLTRVPIVGQVWSLVSDRQGVEHMLCALALGAPGTRLRLRAQLPLRHPSRRPSSRALGTQRVTPCWLVSLHDLVSHRGTRSYVTSCFVFNPFLLND